MSEQEIRMSVTYQVSHEDLCAILNGQLKRSVHGQVLDLGVDVHMDTKQEEHSLHILVQHSKVEEVLASVINLIRRGEEQKWRSA